MAELNLKQIIDRLNAEFVGDTRKLVFWYDDKADFAEDLENVELENAKIYRLQPDNQFYTKYFLERVDTTTNYLVYAPFPKPDVRENHLEDTLLYSRRFSGPINEVANIISELHELGRSDAWISRHLGMDKDEILRLKQITGLTALFKEVEFGRAWKAIENDLQDEWEEVEK